MKENFSYILNNFSIFYQADFSQMTSNIVHEHLGNFPISSDANIAIKQSNKGNALSQDRIQVKLYKILELELQDTFLDILISEW